MATPRRRSSRLRGMTPQKPNGIPTTALTALTEGDESHADSAQAFNSFASPSSKSLITNTQNPAMSFVKTPTTASRIQPNPEEMHPSRYQTTAKKASSGKRLSIVNAQLCEAATNQDSIITSSPTRQSFASPGFQFRFRQSTDLSSEARRMMEEIREQASRIKEGLATEREEQMRKEDEVDNMFGRRMATPKGKLGRFSDVHMDQFKKMNSIEKHASAFRAEPVRSNLPTVTTAKLINIEPSTVADAASLNNVAVPLSLKRTHSKVDLLKPEATMNKLMPTTNKHHEDSEREMSPSKRFKQRHEASIASRSADAHNTLFNSALTRIDSGIPLTNSTFNPTTPSKIPMARSASVKSLKTTNIPSLGRSPSTKSLATPNQVAARVLPHTDGAKRYRTSIANKFTRMKSILRQPQIRFSDDPAKIVAGTHLATPKGSQTTAGNNGLAAVPEITTPGTPSRRKEKHVVFSPAVTELQERSAPPAPTTTSPIKVPGSYPVLYPALAGTIMNNLPATPTHAPTHLAINRTHSARAASMAGPGDFTFRADKSISFGPVPSRSGDTPTIRRVRASDTAALMNLTSTNAASKDGLQALPHTAHGLSNKKRKRDSTGKDSPSTHGDDKENTHTEPESDFEQRGSPTKKARITTEVSAPKTALVGNAAKPMKGMMTSGAGSRIPKRKGGSMLSLSRLNALARPKDRK